MQNNSFNQNIELAMNINNPFADKIFDALAIKQNQKRLKNGLYGLKEIFL